jgi:hypothetical protein
MEWLFADETGRPLLAIKSLLKMAVKADGKVVSGAIEAGSFASYNKTAAPLEITVQLGFEGANADIADALDALRDLKDKVSVFSLVTPYGEHESMTLQSYDYQLTRENGLCSLYADCSLVEIKEVNPVYSAVDASDASTVNGGQVATGSTDAPEAEKAERESILHGEFGVVVEGKAQQ